jgi:hypothetical protein
MEEDDVELPSVGNEIGKEGGYIAEPRVLGHTETYAIDA